MQKLARLDEIKMTQLEIQALVDLAVLEIKRLCNPKTIILFGSATGSNFDRFSDLDFVLIFKDIQSAKLAQQVLYRNTNLFPCSVDFVCVDLLTYETKSALGGVLWIAKHEGRILT